MCTDPDMETVLIKQGLLQRQKQKNLSKSKLKFLFYFGSFTGQSRDRIFPRCNPLLMIIAVIIGWHGGAVRGM